MCQSVWCEGKHIGSCRKLAELLCVNATALPGAPTEDEQAEITRLNNGFDWRDGCLCGIDIRKAFKGKGYRISQHKVDSMMYVAKKKPMAVTKPGLRG